MKPSTASALSCTLVLLALLAVPGPAAAETSDTCTGTISSLPATITGSGVYCVTSNLTTALSSGIAISINNSDVTLECNGHSISNLAAGTTTATVGIKASQRRFVRVHGCHLRGFYTAIQLTGDLGAAARSRGHSVEGNLVEGALANGIFVQGEHSVIRDNRIIDTGMHATASPAAITLRGSVDVLDNTIDGVVTPSGTFTQAFGIYAQSDRGSVIARNTIRNVLPDAKIGWGTLVNAGVSTSSVHDNVYVASVSSASLFWLRCSSALNAKSRRNIAQGWAVSADTNCLDDDAEDFLNP